MHRALSLLSTKILFILLILGAAPPAWAATCLFYTNKESCERYTDSGSCIWNAQARACLDGGPSLPPGTVGVAIVGLDPQSAPLELKPGPSVSFGNVSLVNGSEISVKFGEEKAFSADGAAQGTLPEGEASELSKTTEGVIKAAAAPQSEIINEIAVFCTLPPVMGRCRGFLRRWYWDGAEGRCIEFTYGGCGGNDNNFANQQECELAAQESC